MSLIECSECKKQVSDRASSCPNCGAPVQQSEEAYAAGTKLNTIQETSKKFKIQSIFSTLLICVGLLLAFLRDGNMDASEEGDIGISGIIFMVGLIWYLVNRFRIWWHHK